METTEKQNFETTEEMAPGKVYNAFWPAVLVLVAFLINYGYEIHEIQAHRGIVNYQYAHDVAPNLERAQSAQDRLISLLRDLIDTSAKNPNAKIVVNECHQVGILRERPAATGTAAATQAAMNPNGTNAAPATNAHPATP